MNKDANLQERVKNTFFIKTFQVFSSSGEPISIPILTEQVFGNFETIRLYDTSILARGSRLYYFKRIHVNPKNEDGDYVQDGQSYNDDVLYDREMQEDVSNFSRGTKGRSKKAIAENRAARD